MATLHLVRHARPVLVPNRPPAMWELDGGAAADIARLRDSGVLPDDALWASSSEPKALATARSLTDRPVISTDGLREMRRPHDLLPQDRFRAAVRASLREPDLPAHPRWDTGADTVRRVRAALDSCVREAGRRDLVLVGHGTAWTLLISALTDTDPDVAGWEGLRLPDHCAIHLARAPARVVSPWGSWLPRP